MAYVIMRRPGQFVALPGRAKSYTNKLKNAQTFASREEATANKCGNECVIQC